MRKLAALLASSCLALLIAVPASAAQFTLAWDANTEVDLAGYLVQYGPTSAPFTTTVDVGNVTQWTFVSAPGVTYAFRVVAYNTNGERSDPSAPIYANPDGTLATTLVADRPSLNFGYVTTAAQTRTRTQTLRLTQSGVGAPVAWTATSTASWLQVSPASGSGSGAISISLVPSAIPASDSTASITISAPGAANSIAPISVSLNVITPAVTAPPFGSFDTPANGTSGVTGSLAITGWALDDVDVARVRIMRDPVAGETPGQLVYIGDAALVEDARPDVAQLYSWYPDSYRTGWGYLALTNMFPNTGNGTFKLTAIADDVDGHSTVLGSKTITCTNATAKQPFGAIDTPGQGATVSGIVTNFGWVLSPGTGRADGAGGGSVTVVIDGVAVGSPAGWTSRADLSALFPIGQYSGVNFAEAVFSFDSTTLGDGIHTMAWIVTDTKGQTAGIGSRYFRVFNGNSALMAASMADSVAAASLEGDVAGASVDRSPVDARRGFDLDTPFRTYAPDRDGVVTLQSEELDRIEVKTNGATQGFLRAGANLRPLPIGSHLDAATGTFVWQPGVAFVGGYDLTFVRRVGNHLWRQDVRIVLNPKGSNRVGPQLVVDQVRPFVAGWAADLDSASGPGISTIHVWAYPLNAVGVRGTPIFVGVAAYGGERPDVGAIFGDRFANSGYGIYVTDLPPGSYDLALFPWSTVRNGFLAATVVRVDVK